MIEVMRPPEDEAPTWPTDRSDPAAAARTGRRNRGPLLGRDGELARYSSGRRWLICVLEFKGRRRVQWTPGRLTELYFLDEASGLAAGDRPCAECRRPAHR